MDRTRPVEQNLPGGVRGAQLAVSSLRAKHEPPELEEIRADYLKISSGDGVQPSAAEIFAAYERAVPWLIEEVERWQPLGDALGEAALQIGAEAIKVEKLTAALAESKAEVASLERSCDEWKRRAIDGS